MSGNGDSPGLMPEGGIGSSGHSLTLQIAVVCHGRGSDEVRSVALPLQLGFKGITGEFRSVNPCPGQLQAGRQQVEATLIWDGVIGSSTSSDLLLLGF